MDQIFARALSAIVRSELGRAGISADAAQKAIGVSPAAWRNYFTNHKREVKTRVLIDLANLFEMPLSRLIALTEVEEARLRARTDDPLLAPQTAAGKRAVEEGRAQVAADPFLPPADENGDDRRDAV